MLRINSYSERIVFFAIIILVLFETSIIYAAPPVAEIRTIFSQKALNPPPPELLKALDAEHINTCLQEIDPYARYVPPKLSSTSSSLPLRLGIDVFEYKSHLWVRREPGGPASKVGIPEISELQAINNKSVRYDGLAQVLTQLDKAVRKRKVTLTVSRRLGEEGKAYTVKPSTFYTPSIEWHRSANYIVIRINDFVAHDTAPTLSALYTTLVKARTPVIIDLRGCPGGDLYEAIGIAGMFVPAKLSLISTSDRLGNVKSYQAPPGKKLPHPTFLLIDNRTASSAEFFSGILQHHHLTRLVGERSYGKCVSQTILPLSDGSSLWLTTLSVRFPGNMPCTEKGITPDIPYPDITIAKTDDIIKKLPLRHRHHINNQHN